jgi:hypothetical protein
MSIYYESGLEGFVDLKGGGIFGCYCYLLAISFTRFWFAVYGYVRRRDMAMRSH